MPPIFFNWQMKFSTCQCSTAHKCDNNCKYSTSLFHCLLSPTTRPRLGVVGLTWLLQTEGTSYRTSKLRVGRWCQEKCYVLVPSSTGTILSRPTYETTWRLAKMSYVDCKYVLVSPLLPTFCRCRRLFLQLITHTHSVELSLTKDRSVTEASICTTYNIHKK
jgi:hypothetical protein